ncbi:hypothetical protein KEM54_002885, partial [Ascosphaera aggregata]
MLPGPAPQNDYFDTVGVGRTVTPHESGLRSGLTPAGLPNALGMPSTPLGGSYLLGGAGVGGGGAAAAAAAAATTTATTTTTGNVGGNDANVAPTGSGNGNPSNGMSTPGGSLDFHRLRASLHSGSPAGGQQQQQQQQQPSTNAAIGTTTGTTLANSPSKTTAVTSSSAHSSGTSSNSSGPTLNPNDISSHHQQQLQQQQQQQQQEQQQHITSGNMDPPKNYHPAAASASDPFAQHDADAANGLYMLAKGGAQHTHSHPSNRSDGHHPNGHHHHHLFNASGSGNNDGSSGGGGNNSAFAVHGIALSNRIDPSVDEGSVTSPTDDNMNVAYSPQDSISDVASEKPNASRRASRKKSSGSVITGGGTSAATAGSAAGGLVGAGMRRKVEDMSAGTKNKRVKNVGDGTSPSIGDPSSPREGAFAPNKGAGNVGGSGSADTKDKQKPSEEERRRNFLERNRVAALKCRQRKKQWLQGIQEKNEFYQQENETLHMTVRNLRQEVTTLKVMLLGHADCNVTQAQQQQLMSQGLPIRGMHAILANMPTPNGQSLPEYTPQATLAAAQATLMSQNGTITAAIPLLSSEIPITNTQSSPSYPAMLSIPHHDTTPGIATITTTSMALPLLDPGQANNLTPAASQAAASAAFAAGSIPAVTVNPAVASAAAASSLGVMGLTAGPNNNPSPPNQAPGLPTGPLTSQGSGAGGPPPNAQSLNPAAAAAAVLAANTGSPSGAGNGGHGNGHGHGHGNGSGNSPTTTNANANAVAAAAAVAAA